jgi:A/G-specific adenine glycosylase
VNLAGREIPSFQGRLLAWFRSRKRDLPWRRTRNPYPIWLSEVMLQQTRVDAVLPYYRRFLARFPTVRALAGARSEDVLRLWSGLGYYSRARNLHRAARILVKQERGQFPRELDAALKLPGIGRYTAAAVLSIAFGEPLAVLDGNVARVLARLGALRRNLRAPHRWRQLQSEAQKLLATEAPGDWNQSMMELGATLCTPRNPRCNECPVSRWCRALQLGIAAKLPVAGKKRARVRLQIAAAVLLDPRGRTILVKDPADKDAAPFSRLWQFPAVRVSRDPATELRQHLSSYFAEGELPSSATPELLPLARHSVTFRQIGLLPILFRVTRLPNLDGAHTARLAAVARLAVSNATRKIARAAMEALRSPGPTR